MPYSEVTVAGYNASPPPDDGTQVAANEVTWAGIKSKIGDPIKTAFDTCQTNITDVVDNEIEAYFWAEPTTAVLFYQAAAPTNWTKSVANNDKAIRIVSGLTGGTAGGTTAFSSVLAARTIAQANLPNVNFSNSLTAASHTHSISITSGNNNVGHTHTYSGTTSGRSVGHTHSGTTSSSGSHNHSEEGVQNNSTANAGPDRTTVSGDTNDTSTDGSHTHTMTTGTESADHTHTYSGTTSGISVNHTHLVSGTSGSSGSLAVSGTVSSGGSGTAMDFAIQYMDCIVATKDT